MELPSCYICQKILASLFCLSVLKLIYILSLFLLSLHFPFCLLFIAYLLAYCCEPHHWRVGGYLKMPCSLVLSWPRILLNLSQHGKVFFILHISMTVLSSPKSFAYCFLNVTPPTSGSGLPLCPPSALCVFIIVPTYLSFTYLNSSWNLWVF